MDLGFRDRFLSLWEKYFTGAELPLTFYYSDEEPTERIIPESRTAHRCILSDLNRARRGSPLLLNTEGIGCFGGKKYAGFPIVLPPNFEYFLSCGIPGEFEGERYKKSPDLVRDFIAKMPEFSAPKKSILFKRWDLLTANDHPEVVIFFAKPDVLSGLFTLCGYDESDLQTVIAPFGAGCATIVMYPYLEAEKAKPKGILGMFDVSARPFVPGDSLTFAVPINKFSGMVENMKESFLITNSWKQVLKRIRQSGEDKN
jgi:hypothetical protein